MKAFVVSVCALLASASAGSVAYPGPTSTSSQHVVNTRQGKSFGFATTQYINGIPSTVPVAFAPHFSYPVPSFSPFAPIPQPIHQGFYPVPGTPYFPGTVLYPSYPGLIPPTHVIPGHPGHPGHPFQPVAPIAPPQPAQDTPTDTSPGGDVDTAVVDSADFPNQEQPQGSSTEAPQQDKPDTPQQDEAPSPQQPPSSNFPTYPQLPQIPPQAPSFPLLPQYPQYPQGGAGFPTFPSIQFPQGTLPAYPQIPQFPSNQPSYPQAPPAAYPGGSNDDRGLNDEDTVSIESA